MRESSTFKIENLIEEDILSTQRYIEEFCKKSLTPEERLILAVLEDAVITFQKYAGVRTPQATVLFKEVEEWVLDRDGETPFSFNNVCAALHLDPGYVRSGLMRWKQTHSKKRSKPGKRPSWIQLHRVDSLPKLV